MLTGETIVNVSYKNTYMIRRIDVATTARKQSKMDCFATIYNGF